MCYLLLPRGGFHLSFTESLPERKKNCVFSFYLFSNGDLSKRWRKFTDGNSEKQ